MWCLSRQFPQKPDAVGAALAHPDDAPAANGDSRGAHAAQSIEPLLVPACRYDFTVELRRGVQIMVVRRQTCFGKPFGLLSGQHAESATRFQPQRADPPHHLDNPFEFIAFGGITPRRPHAESRGAVVPRRGRGV